ncbi:MAG: preprotein translocase subunit SecD [Chlamydiae bacterium RIFCSPHIGHO2_12_FULL_49_32]|nr:MAG: preprotein translocase subunit SecD [Chlamydiae bacterium RIFCSPHIGHO2_12_FULL_49_32]
METRKRWQLYLIVVVVLLTIYNILPTIFYYSKPLHEPIGEREGNRVALSIAKRVNSLEGDAIDWLRSFFRLLKIKPSSLTFNLESPEVITLQFKSNEEAETLRRYLPRSGEMIAFAPSQLALQSSSQEVGSKQVVVQRRIPIHFNLDQLSSYFQFSQKWDLQGEATPLYKAIVQDRAIEIALAVGGTSENAEYTLAAPGNLKDPEAQEIINQVAQNVVAFVRTFGEETAIAKRYFASFSQVESDDRSSLISGFSRSLEELKKMYTAEKNALSQKEAEKRAGGAFLDTLSKQRLELLSSKLKNLTAASEVLSRRQSLFAAGQEPLTYPSLQTLLQQSDASINPKTGMQILSLEGRNPFIESLSIDWQNEKIFLTPYSDLTAYLTELEQQKSLSHFSRANQFLIDEIAALARKSQEKIVPSQERFEIGLSSLQNSNSFLLLPLKRIGKALVSQVKEGLSTHWSPRHPDLIKENFPIWDYDTYLSLPPAQKKVGLIVFSPADSAESPPKGFRMNSIYVIAKGIQRILEKFEASPHSESAKQFLSDFQELRALLQKRGFYGRPATLLTFDHQVAGDFIFEARDYYQTVLKASRENFTVYGTGRYATLECSSLEQRILAQNKIDNAIHEDLLKWRDNYNVAKLGLRGLRPTDVPKPTQSPLFSNFKLSLSKYFRGDDRKILHWGLDLSGGKTVQLELRDTRGRPVTQEADINQGINELFNRVNKMGVSEVGIRREGNFITLDFPGSQSWSAQELVKASSMFFHLVNEKFSTLNSGLSMSVDRFLQEVWNEADVTGKKEIEEINAIAWKHLYGDSLDPDIVEPRTAAAKVLYDNGLRLALPQDSDVSSAFNDSLSKIAILRGEELADWHGQTHPLLIVFRNYALEGSDLENIHAAYDPTKGNYLSFSVRSSRTTAEGEKTTPRADLFAWSSQFSKEKIAGTPNEIYSRGQGWRMAVILNSSIISAPTLDAPIRDNATITGSFTQREINAMEADLKAGSLTFTPKILSEKNVSPDLGVKERYKGIFATGLGLLLVILSMLLYYRFGGLIASAAVIFNLLIMWATLQNLEATLTLPSIAGIILTMGMAVDANVLVFERIREEFALTQRLASSVMTGYRKAFSAIFDSNLTTIIAAIVLLQFDSGPIRAFAITLIIGIISSMFSALFMTRFFFAGWVKNPKHQRLSMAQWIKTTRIDFIKYAKIVPLISLVIILAGSIASFAKRETLLGMDFTGGYALNFELEPRLDQNYRPLVEAALMREGLSPRDFQIRELTPSNHIRLFLSRSLDKEGSPFYGLPPETESEEIGYLYEKNPRISWIVDRMNAAGLKILPASLERLEKNWTDVSGQISQKMRHQAFLGLAIALFCILLYITFRFEFTYAFSATVCLAHDVLISLGAIGLLHYFRVPIQIDLTLVAALLTIVGYSLNDTIIVFDRIRENLKLHRKESLVAIVNHSLNETLSRTLMTSLTTLLAILPLVFLGGSTLFGFALVMTIGIVFGTLSSLYIASPLMLYLNKRRSEKNSSLAKSSSSSG